MRQVNTRGYKGLLAAPAFFFLLVLGWHDQLPALNEKRPDSFLLEERRAGSDYFGEHKNKGLPPGLAKKSGSLHPGLQNHLGRKGTKRLEPLAQHSNARPAFRQSGAD